jgi:hypothetical protein
MLAAPVSMRRASAEPRRAPRSPRAHQRYDEFAVAQRYCEIAVAQR